MNTTMPYISKGILKSLSLKSDLDHIHTTLASRFLRTVLFFIYIFLESKLLDIPKSLTSQDKQIILISYLTTASAQISNTVEDGLI